MQPFPKVVLTHTSLFDLLKEVAQSNASLKCLYVSMLINPSTTDARGAEEVTGIESIEKMHANRNAYL